MTVLLLALGGAAGAVCRYHASRLVQARFPGGYPAGTFAVNLSGCMLLGLLLGLLGRYPALARENVALLLGAGFCGAYTTFSSFALETTQLWRSGSGGWALFNLLAQALCGLLATWGGLSLALWLG